MTIRRWLSFHSQVVILTSLVLLSSTAYVAAATPVLVQVGRQIFDSLSGSYVNVTNRVFAVDLGFARAAQPAPASGTSSTSPVVFSPTTGIATNAIVQGDWVITFSVNTTSATPTNAPFTATLNFNRGTSSSFKLYLATGSVVSSSPPYQILCEFDIGPSLSSPYSYTLSVQ